MGDVLAWVHCTECEKEQRLLAIYKDGWEYCYGCRLNKTPPPDSQRDRYWESRDDVTENCFKLESGKMKRYIVHKYPSLYGTPRSFKYRVTARLYVFICSLSMNYICEVTDNETG